MKWYGDPCLLQGDAGLHGQLLEVAQWRDNTDESDQCGGRVDWEVVGNVLLIQQQQAVVWPDLHHMFRECRLGQFCVAVYPWQETETQLHPVVHANPGVAVANEIIVNAAKAEEWILY